MRQGESLSALKGLHFEEIGEKPRPQEHDGDRTNPADNAGCDRTDHTGKHAIAASTWRRPAADDLTRGGIKLVAHVQQPQGLLHDIKDCRTQIRIDNSE